MEKRERGRKALFNLYKNFINNNSLIFDIGANIGEYTKVFHRFGRVIAIEPQSYLAKLLRQRFYKNNNITIIQKGVAEKEGIEKILINSGNRGISSFRKDDTYQNKFVGEKADASSEIEMTTLDNLIKDYGLPEFIKIDVEGYESKVLKGLHSKVKLISFEFGTDFLEDLKQCIDLITKIDKNYSFNLLLAGKFSFELNKWVNKEKLMKFILNPKSNSFGEIFCKLKTN